MLADAATSVGATIVGGFARRPQSRQEFARDRGGREFESYDEVLGADDVDGVLLATPNSTHADQIVAAAEAGKHVFVEKPFTLDVNSAKRAVAAAESAGIVLQVGHNKRRQPANRMLKALIDDGELGTVTMVETQQSTPFALGFKEGYWRANDNESPLGGMTSLGVHMLDTMTYLLGRIESVSVFSKRILRQPPIDHATAIIFEFESGALGYLGTSFVVPRTTTVTVRGTGGSATNDVDGTRFYRQGIGDERPNEVAIDSIDTVADELSEFSRSVRGVASPETGGPEGTEVVAILEAALASYESGTPRRVDEFR